MIKNFASRQFIYFLIVGGLAAIINFVSRIFFNQYVPFSVALILAYLLGMAVAFLLSRYYVFVGSHHSIKRSATYFILVNLVAIIQTWAVSISLLLYIFPVIGIKRYPEMLAHAVGVAFPVFTSYLGHKKLSFG